jgi:hypothetical protein
VILLQIDLASNDELETICKGFYEIKNTSIFTWFSIPDVGHHRWLHGLIRHLFFNNKANYLIRTIRRIPNFLQL